MHFSYLALHDGFPIQEATRCAAAAKARLSPFRHRKTLPILADVVFFAVSARVTLPVVAGPFWRSAAPASRSSEGADGRCVQVS